MAKQKLKIMSRIIMTPKEVQIILGGSSSYARKVVRVIKKKNNKIVVIIATGQSDFKNELSKLIAFISNTTPKTKPILAMLEPTIFPKAISEYPAKAALILTIISGADVAKETIVKPTIIFEILNFKDNPIADFNNQFPPKTNKTKPTTIYKKFMKFKLIKQLHHFLKLHRYDAKLRIALL